MDEGVGGTSRKGAYGLTTYEELRFRDCPWCKASMVEMTEVANTTLRAANGEKHGWVVLSCRRCARLVCLELMRAGGSTKEGQSFGTIEPVLLVRQVPEAADAHYRVDHLPEDVAKYLKSAVNVLAADEQDAAAVQLRRTLEAAAAHRGVDKKRRLVEAVQELIRQGAVTQDFKDVLDYVRKLGNLGAHAGDTELSRDEVERALRFTVQLLRNLFEVPGELALLKAEASDKVTLSGEAQA